MNIQKNYSSDDEELWLVQALQPLDWVQETGHVA